MSETKWLEVKRKPEIHEFTALSAFAGLLINGDGSGLTFQEGMKLDRYCEANGFTLDKGHFSYSTEDNESHFARCEVLGIHGDCVTFHYVQMTEDNSEKG